MAKDQLQPQNVPANFCALARLCSRYPG